MQNRVPIKREDRPPLPDFAPVPRLKHRHDGWTPQRQRAFIAALADTGSVTRAAAMVNMAQANCYTLRRAAGAEEFRRAWAAALDFGVQRLKDIAFERAIEGQLVPVFMGGKLMGYRRKRNDALLMFCLRHYGQGADGRATTINYFSTRASASADGTGGVASGAASEASTTTMRTVVKGGGGTGNGDGALADDAAARLLRGFGGVTLDAEAEAAMAAVLADCAARTAAREAAYDVGGLAGAEAALDDPGEPFVRIPPQAPLWHGELEPPVIFDHDVPLEEIDSEWVPADALPDGPGEPDAPKIAAVKRRRGRRAA